ncbi:hypothetical protein AAFF_G00209560 [Aldrovandia affinis]|uniref:Spindle and kinetochore-associated protein 3 n=1 Tax=Aldrovandia affinis TaxID=143900 RepID=A0AAD7SWB6_9TELE|nr:hypothetical protein AAFF_G00209560 [Aldrovandia affinis]
MDTSSVRFFGKVRKLAVFLETETANLQQAHQNTDDDSTEGAVRVLHELYTEVRGMRGQVQDQLARNEVEGKEMRKLIQMFMVLKQRTTEDIQRLTKHYEKYGYRQPTSTQKHSEVNRQEVEEVDTGAHKEEEEEQVKYAEAEEHPCVTPAKIPPPANGDPMRTPRLSDFGLSQHHFVNAWSNLEKPLAEAPEAPRLMPSSMAAASQPVLPKTPKCTLRMDEEALTPRLEDFGITEHTMCLNNDFTMDLLRKKPTKSCSMAARGDNLDTAPKADHSKFTLASTSATNSPDTSESMDSPEPPVLMTPGFKLKKTAVLLTPPNKGLNSQPHLQTTDPPSTPEIPVFETPYVHKLLSTVKKNQRDGSAAAALEQKPRPSENPFSNRGPDVSGVWSRDLPDLPYRPPQKEERTPEMPNLESFLSNKFPHRTAGAHGKPLPEERGVGEQFGLKGHPLPFLGGHDLIMQEWRLVTPPTRSDYITDPSTPEMPDVSSVTQDIFKLLPQCETKPSTAIQLNQKPADQPNPKAAALKTRAKWAQGLAPVSEREFLSLPGHLRQIPLTCLNKAIQNINSILEVRHSGGDADPHVFLMDDLKRITGTGIKASVYLLCLKELKRLEMQGEGHSAVCRVLTLN